MSELHLRPFAKRERIQIFREISNLKYICKNEWDKSYFSHDAAYSDSKNLTKRTIPVKTLKDEAH